MKSNICRHCGKWFVGTSKKQYCSETCKEDHLKRACLECGKEFIGKNHVAKFCCGACQLEDQKKRQRLKARKNDNKGFYGHDFNPCSDNSFFENENDRRKRLGRKRL